MGPEGTLAMRELTPETTDMTTGELALAIGVHRNTALRMCERGDVPARLIGRHWRIKVQALRDLYPELWSEYLERYQRRTGRDETNEPIAPNAQGRGLFL